MRRPREMRSMRKIAQFEARAGWCAGRGGRGARKRLRTWGCRLTGGAPALELVARSLAQLSATRDKRIIQRRRRPAAAANRLGSHVRPLRRRLTCRLPAMWSTFAERIGRFLRRSPPVGARNGEKVTLGVSESFGRECL